ncbi:MAG: ABC transporter substrate-binding protein [Candidatus Thorarchaeota archaeon]
MESEIESSSRICPITPSSKKGMFEHLRPRTIFMAVSLSFILTTTGMAFIGGQPGPIPLPTLPLPPPEPDALVYTIRGGAHTLEPTWYNPWVASSCYDTLMSYDRERMDRFRPLLVTEVPSLENGRISSDGMTYRFTMRNDSPLTPEDVEYSIERAMVRAGGSSRMLREALVGGQVVETSRDMTGPHYNVVVDFEDIDNAVEAEGNDVVFHLARIYPPFMHVLTLTSASILSKAWCVEAGDWPGTEETWVDYIDPYDSPLDYATQGFGPFMLESLTLSHPDPWPPGIMEVVLVRNEDYWRGPARLERVEIKFIDDWETRKQMFIEGDADICWVPPENYTELEGVEGIRVHTGLPTLGYDGLYFNFATANNSPYIGSGELDRNGVPPDFFSDIDVRKAFVYSIDYDTIINEIYAGEAQQPASPVIEGLSFHNPDQESYTYDLDMARQHFQQAWRGELWNKGFNVTLVFQGLSLMGNVWAPDRLSIAEMIKNSIESINTNFQVTVEPLLFIAWNPTSFCIDGHYPGPGLRYLSNLEPPYAGLLDGYGTIFHGYNGSTVDSLIEAGMNTVDPEARQAIYYELQRVYHEDVPGIPLAQPLTRHYQRDWVWGWYYNPAAGMDFYEMLKGTCQDATRNIIAHVTDLVDSGFLGADAGSSLTETLDSAIALMDNGNLTMASQKLNDFIDQVNTLDLPVWDGEELIALAQEILEVLTPSATPTDGGFDMTMILPVGGGVVTIVFIVFTVWRSRKGT